MENIITFGIVAILIVIAPFLSSLTHLPLVAVEIVLGALAFHFGLFSHLESLEFVAKIGFLFLMFLCGLEVDLKTFTKLGDGFLKSAFLYFFILYGATFLYVLNTDLSEFYIVALPVMSLGMIMAMLKEYPKNTPWLQLALNVGILGELISIVALVVLNGAYSHGLTWELYKTLLVLFLFLSVIVGVFKVADVLFWWFPTLKFFLIPKESSKNQDIRFSAMLFFILIGITQILGLESVLGAFLAGMILATYFHHQKGLADKLNAFGFGFFIPLFFVYVGSTLDLNLMLKNLHLLSLTLSIIAIMVSLRLIAAFVAYRKYFKNYVKTALFAFSHAMPLTFLVATAQLGMQFEAISTEEYYALILAALMEGIFLTIGIKMLYSYGIKHKANQES
ncbi:cation:proton antiporter [Helicobacter turcicus]|uniref:Cation:proton antiporter n=1 Tax=Helicobacter turcicus TaxID=2867412 RepID=A0ABS7JP35_9HELI|nr:cation:proton antiporter [Helicobacter turcicus]MBX7491119.1 cation:proton antiporter [Helicobacter turcicus]MBX7545983.1 cation:proton antiporter [Helicobacter turcicus]